MIWKRPRRVALQHQPAKSRRRGGAAADEDPGDGTVIRVTLKHVARTRNMNALAHDAGLNRGNLSAISTETSPLRRRHDGTDE